MLGYGDEGEAEEPPAVSAEAGGAT
jgi:hypothetical protein